MKKISWKNITKIQIDGNKLIFFSESIKDTLKNDNQFIGFTGSKEKLKSILIKNNNLHVDIFIDPETSVGKIDKA